MDDRAKEGLLPLSMDSIGCASNSVHMSDSSDSSSHARFLTNNAAKSSNGSILECLRNVGFQIDEDHLRIENNLEHDLIPAMSMDSFGCVINTGHMLNSPDSANQVYFRMDNTTKSPNCSILECLINDVGSQTNEPYPWLPDKRKRKMSESRDKVSFFDETTIHGLKETKRSDFPFSRGIWIFMLVGCFCGVSYEIYQVVSYYKSNPSASQVKWVVQEAYDYPPMIFCPKTFLNMKKVKKLNMSTAALAYTVSLFQEVQMPKNFDLNSTRIEVKNLMKRMKLKSYMDLFAAVSFDGNDVLKDASTKKPLDLSIYIPGYGLCYRLNLEPVKRTKIRSIQHVEIIYQPPGTSSEYDFVYGTTLLVRESSGVKADMILLTNNAFYQIDFEVQLHRRMSRPGAECFVQTPDNYYIGDCEFTCIENETYESGCKDCLPYSILDTMHDVDHIWPCENLKKSADAPISDKNVTEEEALQNWCSYESVLKRANVCLESCLPVCEQWIYKHSTLTFDYHKSNVHIRLLYNPTDGILTYEEVPTYTFDTFVSNIGGQLGLWLGASVVSIFQILYYTCLSLVAKAGLRFRKMHN